MGINPFKSKPGGDATEEPTPVPEPAADSNSKEMGVEGKVRDDDHELPEVTSTYQAGVRNIEAMTTVWTMKDMCLAYGK